MFDPLTSRLHSALGRLFYSLAAFATLIEAQRQGHGDAAGDAVEEQYEAAIGAVTDALLEQLNQIDERLATIVEG